MNYKDIPCIKDKTYFILATFNGSWLTNSIWKELNDEEFCRRIIRGFEDNMMFALPSVQRTIDDSYEEILDYRASKLI
jgi:2-phosphoglycerate kinase